MGLGIESGNQLNSLTYPGSDRNHGGSCRDDKQWSDSEYILKTAEIFRIRYWSWRKRGHTWHYWFLDWAFGKWCFHQLRWKINEAGLRGAIKSSIWGTVSMRPFCIRVDICNGVRKRNWSLGQGDRLEINIQNHWPIEGFWKCQD